MFLKRDWAEPWLAQDSATKETDSTFLFLFSYLFVYLLTATFNIKQLYFLSKDYNDVSDLYWLQNKEPLFTYNITDWIL